MTTLVTASLPSTASAQDAPSEPIAITATAPSAEVPPAPAVEPTPLNPFRIVGRRRRVPRRYADIPMFRLVPPLSRVRVRAGISFPSFGAALGAGAGAVGTGIGLQLGAQIDRVGVFVSGRIETLFTLGYVEGAAIVDYALNDRVQLGTGLGLIGIFANGGVSAPILTFPVHVGATLTQWRTSYGGRTGLHLDVDVEPGVGFGAYPGSAFAVHLGLGWAWL